MIADSKDEIVFKKCPYCGHLNNGDVEVCLSCGVNIREYSINLEEIDAYKKGAKSTRIAQLEAGHTQNRQLKKKQTAGKTVIDNFRVILIILFFFGLVVLLGSIITAYFVRTRNTASAEYLEQAQACVEDNDPDCAFVMVEKASNLGQKESNTEPILLWALEKFIIQDLQTGDIYQMIETLNACLGIDPANTFCLNTLCVDNDWVLDNYQLYEDHEQTIAVIKDILYHCKRPDPSVPKLMEQIYSNWYQESLENHRYLKAWKIIKEWNAIINE